MSIDYQKQFVALHDSCSVSVYDKLSQLFSERLIDDYLMLLNFGFLERERLLARLHRLQFNIYLLDRYGEENWEVENGVLEIIWAGIDNALLSLVPDQGRRIQLLRGIRDYQELEIGLRYGRSPVRLATEVFYFKKTCDVRMIRQIIELQMPIPIESSLRRLWNCYDLASEVLDDLTDLEEDCGTFNCNRFLIQCREMNVRTAVKEYSQLLDRIDWLSSNLTQRALKGSELGSMFLCRKIDDQLTRGRQILAGAKDSLYLGQPFDPSVAFEPVFSALE